MKEVVLKWRGRDITVRYQCINYGGTHYAEVIDKNGRERRLYKRLEGDSWVWRGGINNNWPDDLIYLLSDFFNNLTPEEIEPDKLWG